MYIHGQFVNLYFIVFSILNIYRFSTDFPEAKTLNYLKNAQLHYIAFTCVYKI